MWANYATLLIIGAALGVSDSLPAEKTSSAGKTGAVCVYSGKLKVYRSLPLLAELESLNKLADDFKVVNSGECSDNQNRRELKSSSADNKNKTNKKKKSAKGKSMRSKSEDKDKAEDKSMKTKTSMKNFLGDLGKAFDKLGGGSGDMVPTVLITKIPAIFKGGLEEILSALKNFASVILGKIIGGKMNLLKDMKKAAKKHFVETLASMSE